MNQSFRISDKALRIALTVGSVILVLTVLILSIAVGSSRRRAAVTTQGSYLTVTDAPGPAATTPPSTETGNRPDPTPQEPILRLTKPAAGYLSAVHDREVLVFSPTMQDYRIHTGIDIETEADAPVSAAAAGTVIRAYEDPMMGYCLEIDHGDGYVTVYRNLSDIVPAGIEVGAAVRAGQLIGSVGASALVEQAELPHLHFELYCNSEPIDPLTYLSYEERAEE